MSDVQDAPDSAGAAATPDPISMALIGRLVGVGRAAVVTWRRRHADFPPAIGGTEESPVFALDAVTAWLTAHGFLRVAAESPASSTAP